MDAELLAPPVAKRPRVGRPHADILSPIEADTRHFGRERFMRDLLLNAGQRRSGGAGTLSEVFSSQAQDLAIHMGTAPAVTTALVLESVVNLATHVPAIAALCAVLGLSDSGALQQIVSGTCTQLAVALTERDSMGARLLLRFLAGLGASGALFAAAFVSQLEALLEVAEGATDRRTAQFLAYAIAASLPFFANPAGSVLAGVGAGSPTVAPQLAALISRLDALSRAISGGPGADVRRASALSAERQGADALDACWLDVPSDAAATGVALGPLAEPSLSRLVRAIAEACNSGAREGEEASSAPLSSVFSALAPCSVCRPWEDPELGELLLASYGKERAAGGAIPPAPPAVQEPPSEEGAPAAAAGGMDTEAPDAGAAVPEGEESASGKEARGSSGRKHAPAPPKEGGCPATCPPVVLFSFSSPSAHTSLEDDGGGVGGSRTSADAEAAEGGGKLVFHVSGSPAPPPAASSAPTCAAGFFVRPAVTVFGPGGLSSTPAVMKALRLDDPSTATPLSLWALREVIHDVIVAYHPLHDAAAEMLRRLPMGAGVEGGTRAGTLGAAAVPLVVEAILTQLLWPCGAPLEQTYYSVLTIGLLAGDAAAAAASGPAAGSSAAQVLGLAARVLWKNAALLDDGCVLSRLAPWLAHHVSNMKWEWMWKEWAPALLKLQPSSSSTALAQERLLSSLLTHTFALVGPWHYERIVAEHFAVPFASQTALIPVRVTDAASSVLLPLVTRGSAPKTDAGAADPEAGGVGGAGDADDSAAATGAAPATVVASSTSSSSAAAAAAVEPAPSPALLQLAEGVMGHLKSKTDAPGLGAWLATTAPALRPELRLLAAAHCIFMHGRANLRNASVLLERYHGLLSRVESHTQSASDADGSSADAPFAAVGWCGEPLPSFLVPSAAVSRPDDVRADILCSAAFHVWRKALHVARAQCLEMARQGIVSHAQLVRFALDPSVRFPSGHYHATPGGTAAAAPSAFAAIVHGRSGDWDSDMTDAATPWPAVTDAAAGDARVRATASDGAADAPGHHAVHRALTPHCWDLAHASLERAVASASAAAVALAQFRGGKVLDLTRDEEMDAEAADAAEEALAARVRRAVDARDAALCAALTLGIQLTRTIQGFGALAGGGSTDAGGDLCAEALRVTLSQTRRVFREHAALLSEPGIAGALQTALERSSHHLAGAHEGGARGQPSVDLAAELVVGLRGYMSGRWVAPNPLLRDSTLPAGAWQ